MNKDIDFERAKLLMDIIVEAGKHGPMYQHFASEAGKELKKMIEDDKNREPKIVTPPAGPANSAVQYPDGSVEQLVPVRPQDKDAANKLDDLEQRSAAAKEAEAQNEKLLEDKSRTQTSSNFRRD